MEQATVRTCFHDSGFNYPKIYLFTFAHVTTSQSQGSQHHRGQAQRLEAFRARRSAEETRAMEGNEQGDWAAENEAGCVIGVEALK